MTSNSSAPNPSFRHTMGAVAFAVAAIALHLTADSIQESNFLWVITGWTNAVIGVRGYRRAKAIESHRQDLLMLMLLVFPIIELNRWLGAPRLGAWYLAIEVVCLVLFTFFIGRFSTVELRRLEDRLGIPGMCADSLMISTALLAIAVPVFLGSQELDSNSQGKAAIIALGYLTPGVYMLISTAMMLIATRAKLAPTDRVLIVGSLLLFSHFVLTLIGSYAGPQDALPFAMASKMVVSAAGTCVILYMHMGAPPTAPRQTITRLRFTSYLGAGMLVIALPVAWLFMRGVGPVGREWVWLLCGSVCTAVLAIRLIPLLAQALRWKQEYQHLALHDSLTGLENRHAIDALQLDPGDSAASYLVVFCIDLDDFKSINDLYGHATGDKLLCAVANVLRDQVQQWQGHWPASYKLARVGGDEFMILITTKEGRPRRSQMLDMAEELYRRLARWWDLALDSPVFCKASVGCETMPLDQRQAALHGADKALYASKLSHTGPVANPPSPDAQFPHRQEIRQWTHQALSGSQLPLDLQPIVCANSHQVISYEVLARLPNPTSPGQRLMPATFLNVVDADGLHKLLCRRVLETLGAHHTALQGLQLSINIDPSMLIKLEDAQWLHQQVLVNRIEPKSLTLELLERQVTEEKSLQAAMGWLSRQGYRLAMDDFGSGYSNFQRLSELPFDVLKIDAAVIHAAALGDDEPLQAIQRLAVRRKMSLIAEGVATIRQLAAVQRAGIQLVQGYLHGRPCPISLIAGLETERLRQAAQVP